MGHFLDRAKSFMQDIGLQTLPAIGIDCETSEKSEERSTTLPQNYHLKYPDSQTTEQELREIEARVHKEGFVLLWSHVLEDFVAFYSDEESRGKITPGFVPYSEDELWELFGEGKPHPSQQTLRLIHEAKKQGGRTIPDFPKPGGES